MMELAQGTTEVTYQRRTRYAPAAIVSLITLGLYLTALRNDFVLWDDDLYVVNNLHIRSLDLSFFQWAATAFHASNWHPLTWLSHALDYAVWGLDPRGHHLTSVLMHSVNTFLVALVSVLLLETYREGAERAGMTTILTRSRIALAGAVTGILFGVHPLHVESVAWIAERKDVLCGLFVLLSFLAYTRFVRGATGQAEDRSGMAALFPGRWHTLSLLLFAFALLSKPMAVSLPCVLLILDWHPFGRIGTLKRLPALLLEKLPFFALSALSSVLTLAAQRSGGATEALTLVPAATRLLVAAHAVTAYLAKMLLPIQLLPLYPYPREASLASAEFAVPVLLIAGMTAAGIVVVKKNRLWLSVWGYYLVTLLPVIGIVQVGLQPMADRYTYLPSLGPFLLAGLAAVWVASRTDMISGRRRASRGLLAGAGIAGIALLALLTVQQIGIWRSTIDLWTGLIARVPERVPEAYFKRGNAFREEGRIAQALADYDRTIALDGSFPQVYINRGALQGSLGRIDLALQDFTAAIALDPSVTTAYSNRALAFIALGRYPDALRDLDRVIALDPSSWTSHVSRGRLNLRRGDRDRAIADFRIACAAGEREACRELQRMAVVN